MAYASPRVCANLYLSRSSNCARTTVGSTSPSSACSNAVHAQHVAVGASNDGLGRELGRSLSNAACDASIARPTTLNLC